jgi:hypothetical protein
LTLPIKYGRFENVEISRGYFAAYRGCYKCALKLLWLAVTAKGETILPQKINVPLLTELNLASIARFAGSTLPIKKRSKTA